MALALALVIAVGDSLASGYGLPSPSTQSYAAVFAQRTGSALADLAIPGSQCGDVVNNQIPKMPRGASIVILNCGANDIGGFGYTSAGKPDGTKHTAPANDTEFAAAARDFTRALMLIRAKEPDALICLVDLRHWQRMTGPESPQFAKDVNAWNAMLRATGLRVVDISSDPRMYERAFILPDILHPNVEGNQVIARDLLTLWTTRNALPAHSTQRLKHRNFPTAKRAR
jgi:lysophospholipase L1-like esterase